VFYGIKAAVLVIVVEALLRIAKRALKLPVHWAIAAVSFVGIFFVDLPFPAIIAVAAMIGLFLASEPETEGRTEALPTGSFSKTMHIIASWLAVWFAPLLAVAAAFGPQHILTQLGWFFSKLAMVTFGGAYAVLAYMAQDVVTKHQWLEAGQMLDALGLAETTPGPLILVTEFVAYGAAFKEGGVFLGIFGALVALWATFAPCFLWIFAGAPYIEWIISKPRLRGALTAIAAAVVGVILNLAVWFGLHVFFGKVTPLSTGWLKLWSPDLGSLDWRLVALAAVTGFLILCRHWGIASVLAVASACGLALRYLGI